MAYQNANRGYNRRNSGFNARSNNRFERRPANERTAPWPNFIPDHIGQLIAILHKNKEVARHTSIAILRALVERGEVTQIKGNFVKFGWSKFTVSSDGLSRQYRYDDPVFLPSLVAAFSSVNNVWVNTVNEYLNVEGVTSEVQISLLPENIEVICKETLSLIAGGVVVEDPNIPDGDPNAQEEPTPTDVEQKPSKKSK